MADTMVLYLQRASDDDVVFFPLVTVSTCSHFMQQNVAIQNGTVKGVTIKLNVLGIGNGFTVRRSEIPRWPTCC